MPISLSPPPSHDGGRSSPEEFNMSECPAAVLLIDDDDLIAGSLRHYLLSEGCAADVAVDPDAAVALMRSRDYDVVLVDPYLTGGIRQGSGSLLETIDALQPRAYVIVVTAYVSSAMMRPPSGRAATAVLSKPQPLPALGRLILGALEARMPIRRRRTAVSTPSSDPSPVLQAAPLTTPQVKD
jgi:DNA-binding NtrC family response regulator